MGVPPWKHTELLGSGQGRVWSAAKWAHLANSHQEAGMVHSVMPRLRPPPFVQMLKPSCVPSAQQLGAVSHTQWVLRRGLLCVVIHSVLPALKK